MEERGCVFLKKAAWDPGDLPHFWALLSWSALSLSLRDQWDCAHGRVRGLKHFNGSRPDSWNKARREVRLKPSPLPSLGIGALETAPFVWPLLVQ